MVQVNAETSAHSPVGPSEPGPLLAAADWPVRSGWVPPLADKFSVRSETGPELATALQRAPAIALLPRSRRPGAGTTHDWLRSTGKTQLAAAYAEEAWQSRSVDLLVWIDAGSRASVLSGYVEAARAITGSRMPGAAESIAASFLAWLSQTERRWLIVFDDVPDGAVLPGLWPAGRAGRVLITAASALVVTGLPDVLTAEVGPFSRREAMSYLVGRLSRDPDQRRGAMDLIEELECQPPALTQATAAISGSWLTCSDYRERFLRRSDDVNGPDEAPLPAPGISWTLSVDQADQLVPGGAAQHCLALAAMVAGQGIPASVFTARAASGYITGQNPQSRAPAHWAPPDVEQVMMTLRVLDQVGLITFDPDAEPAIVRMSGVLQHAVRGAMPPDMQKDAAQAGADALLESWPDPEHSIWLGESLRASVGCLRRAAGALLWAGACHPLLLRAGRSLDEASLTGPAVDYWSELTAISDQVFGPGHPESMVLVERLASAYVAAGRVSEAVAWYRRLTEEWSKAFGPDHPRTLEARVRLGRTLVTAGLYAEAISVLTSALTDAERAYGADHPECVLVREAVAAGYRAAGELSEAIRLFRIILAGRERSLGSQHPDTATTRQQLAEAYLADGKPKDAFGQYKRAVADRQRSQGNDHPDTLRARSDFAAAYYQAGRMAMAVQLYEQVYDGSRRALGPDHPDSLAVAGRLGQVYYAVGRLTDAGKLLQDTVNRGERVLAPTDPVVTAARQSLAAIVGES
jgi:tetratricopeptide (TPR) repeat protein